MADKLKSLGETGSDKSVLERMEQIELFITDETMTPLCKLLGPEIVFFNRAYHEQFFIKLSR